MQRLGTEGGRALVTGASGEIGGAIARLLASLGYAVALVGRREDALRTVAESLGPDARSTVLRCDVTDPDAVLATIAAAEDALGALDLVVNNAGGALFLSELADVRPAGLRKAIALNLEGAFAVAQAAGARMTQRGSGAIVNIGSISGLRPVPGMGHYGAAKAGLVMLTRSLAVEWGPRGVRVNAVVPGFVRTDGWERMRGHAGFAATGADAADRWVSVDDVAWAVAFLGSPRAAGINGAVLPVDAGMAAG